MQEIKQCFQWTEYVLIKLSLRIGTEARGYFITYYLRRFRNYVGSSPAQFVLPWLQLSV